jgi:hypothetical protein
MATIGDTLPFQLLNLGKAPIEYGLAHHAAAHHSTQRVVTHVQCD